MPRRTWDQWQRRIAFSTNAYKRTSAEQAVTSIASLGYAGCELMADQPHFTPAEMSSRDVMRLAEHVEDNGLLVSNVNAFTGFFAAEDGRPTGDTYHPTWLDADPDRRERRVRHTLSCLRLAAAVGTSTISLQPGGPLVGTGLSREAAGSRFAKGVRRCLPTARELGITITIEPEPGLFLETTDEYRDWKREHFEDDPLVSMNFDVGHAFCVGEDPAIVARDLAGEYAHVHLEDIAATRVHQHLAPGEGAIDFRALFDAFDDVGYVGWVTVELYPFLNDAEGAARRAMTYLRKCLGG